MQLNFVLKITNHSLNISISTTVQYWSPQFESHHMKLYVNVRPLAWTGWFLYFFFCYLRNVYLFLPIIVQVPHLLRLRFNQSCRYSTPIIVLCAHTHIAVRWLYYWICTLCFCFLSLFFSYSFYSAAILCVPYDWTETSIGLSVFHPLCVCVCVCVRILERLWMRTNHGLVFVVGVKDERK